MAHRAAHELGRPGKNLQENIALPCGHDRMKICQRGLGEEEESVEQSVISNIKLLFSSRLTRSLR